MTVDPRGLRALLDANKPLRRQHDPWWSQYEETAERLDTAGDYLAADDIRTLVDGLRDLERRLGDVSAPDPAASSVSAGAGQESPCPTCGCDAFACAAQVAALTTAGAGQVPADTEVARSCRRLGGECCCVYSGCGGDCRAGQVPADTIEKARECIQDALYALYGVGEWRPGSSVTQQWYEEVLAALAAAVRTPEEKAT